MLREGRLEEAEAALAKFDRDFAYAKHADYTRKLYLIEKCIHGVDIQPIAVQIAKLRFFIALVVSQEVEKSKDNWGITALPNLETKIVAADSLMPIERVKKAWSKTCGCAIRQSMKRKKSSVSPTSTTSRRGQARPNANGATGSSVARRTRASAGTRPFPACGYRQATGALEPV